MERCADWGFGGWSPLWTFLFIIMIFVLIRLLWWGGGWHGHGDWHGRGYGATPLDHLKTRYAKGEITKEEFEKMKKDLQD